MSIPEFFLLWFIAQVAFIALVALIFPPRRRRTRREMANAEATNKLLGLLKDNLYWGPRMTRGGLPEGLDGPLTIRRAVLFDEPNEVAEDK